jgi:hypothetical protein
MPKTKTVRPHGTMTTQRPVKKRKPITVSISFSLDPLMLWEKTCARANISETNLFELFGALFAEAETEVHPPKQMLRTPPPIMHLRRR